MEENKNNKNNLGGKLQLKKTINAGQIKQSFSHGRSKSVSVEVKRKRSLSGFSKNEIIEQPKSSQYEFDDVKDIKRKEDSQEIQNKVLKKNIQNIKENSSIESPKRPSTKSFNEKKEDDGIKKDVNEKTKQQKFIKTPKSFENRRQGKLTISQALDDDNEKVRSLAAIKAAIEPFISAAPRP